MDEIASIAAVLMAATVIALAIVRSLPARERVWLLGSWLAHIAAAFFQASIYIYHYEIGDMLTYTRIGQEVASVLRQSFWAMFPEVLRLLFQFEHRLPVDVIGSGTSTGSMSAITALFSFMFGGGAFTFSVCFAFFSFLGKVALYSVFRKVFPEGFRGRLAVAFLFMPSVLVWSSAPLKESVAIFGLGLLVVGLHQVFEVKRLRYFIFLLLGSVVLGLAKPYILFAFGFGIGGWFVSRRLESDGRIEGLITKPWWLVFGLAMALGIAALLGQMFERFSLEKLAESAALQQDASSRISAGSNYSFGDPSATTVTGQLVLAPLALVAAWFRPFIFESRNALMVLNALETTVVAIVFLRVILARPWTLTLHRLLANRWLAFCFVFAVVLGVGVGLGTTNLGTLSRYRVPLQPFFFALLLVLDSSAAWGKVMTPTTRSR